MYINECQQCEEGEIRGEICLMFVAVDFSTQYMCAYINNFKQGKRGISLMLPHIHDFKVLKSVA